MTAPERCGLLDARAKHAYTTWCDALGMPQPPWERLDNAHQAAFRGLVEDVDSYPACATCGRVLMCMACDATTVYVCPDCAERLTCPHCGWHDDPPGAALLCLGCRRHYAPGQHDSAACVARKAFERTWEQPLRALPGRSHEISS